MISYLNRSFQLKQNWLRDEDLTGFGTEVTDLGLEKLDLLARTAASNLQKAVDYRVEIDFMLVRHLKILANWADGARLRMPMFGILEGSEGLRGWASGGGEVIREPKV